MVIGRVDLERNPIKPITICMIGAGGFIGSHLCEKLMSDTPHKFHVLNIKNDSRLEGLIKMADLTINLAAICTPADYNTRPLDIIYSNFIDALPVVKYCSKNSKRLIHFSTCEAYGKTIGCFLPKDNPLRQDPAYYVLSEDASPCIFGPVEKQRWSYACAKQLIERLIYGKGT
ncbi:UDP-D-apiose/UDP-D-xylose synthase 2 [Olea europaea subsp. europaea]|uniref:UDP-D-apiose/UDP-D-xylose synthase 2 n=1 Tax=Olea europaea subsp. europaea TaxID=158383 RepID=A0A8S0PJ58_OLEEU|nr:UDP-D-apiose/UDP-D-xylose synthase 2 [Olea europaea subsp. europaea]